MCLSWSRQLIEPCVISFLILVSLSYISGYHIRIRVKCQPYSIAKTFSFFVCFLFCFLGLPYQQCSKIASNFYEKKKKSVCVVHL